MTRRSKNLLWSRRIALIAITATSVGLVSAHREAVAAGAGWRRHLELKRAEPKVNDTVAVSPKAIKLWFSESVKAADVSIRLTGPDTKPVVVGKVTVDAAALSPAVALISTTLKPGGYSVEWKGLADDGHPATGKFSFTVRAPKQPLLP